MVLFCGVKVLLHQTSNSMTIACVTPDRILELHFIRVYSVDHIDVPIGAKLKFVQVHEKTEA